jgi:hypothetical protein
LKFSLEVMIQQCLPVSCGVRRKLYKKIKI